MLPTGLRHDGEIIGSRGVRQTELHVAHHVCVLDGVVSGDPIDHRLAVRMVLLARGLANVVAGGEQLVVLVWHHPEGLAGEGGALVHHAAALRQKRGAVCVYDIVPCRLADRLAQAARVGNVPGPAGLGAVVGSGFPCRAQQSLLLINGMTVQVLGRS